MRANVLKREEIEARVNEKEFMDDYEAELVSGMLSLEGRWRLINVTKNYPSELVASKCETFYPQNVKTANAKHFYKCTKNIKNVNNFYGDKKDVFKMQKIFVAKKYY